MGYLNPWARLPSRADGGRAGWGLDSGSRLASSRLGTIPAVTQGADGRIQTAYTFRRETIKYMTFDEEWIKHGTTEGGKSADIKPEGVAWLNSILQTSSRS